MPGSKHKKNDDLDEESRQAANPDYMEKRYKQENEQKLDALASAASSIKNMSRNIGGQLDEEKKIQGDLDTGFVKSKELIGQVVSGMDTMLNQASDNICCYIALFTFIMIALLVKFG